MRCRIPAASLLAAALAVPSSAYADSAEYVGANCAYATIEDFTGTVGEPGRYQGEMQGGPIVVADLLDDHGGRGSHLEIARATLHCVIQVGDPEYHVDAPHDGTAHCDFSGTAVVGGVCVVDVWDPDWQIWARCAWLTIEHADQRETVLLVDRDDDPYNGWQCDYVSDPGS